MSAALPIDAALPGLVAAMRRSPAAVLQAPPGAGKTTRVPLALLDALAPRGQIVVLEPRRVAARAAAHQLAKNIGERAGETVGYQVRFENVSSKKTRVLVVTEGILSRRFLRDPTLDGISCVILDEFHERSIHTDLALAFSRELLEVRDDLKVLVMSATLDAAGVARFLGDAPVITSEGRPFPVTIEHVDAPVSREPHEQSSAVAGAIRRALKDDDTGGDVLAFLPGAGEIRRVHERLAGLDTVDVVELYGALSPAEQDRALNRGARRRVVLATNVAETSITIDGVTSVVDSGLMKRAAHDPVTDRESLETVRISLASAEQRAGRAGRTRPGRCLRLWTKTEHATLEASHAPEIARADLARVLLDVLAFHPGPPSSFAFFEPPSPARVARALDVLALLGAVDASRTRLTDKGRALAELPLHPRTGAMLLAGTASEVALPAAVLEDDRAWPREAARTTTDSDLSHAVDMLPRHSARELERAARELERWASGDGALKDALLAGFPDRLCRRRKKGAPEAVMIGGRGVVLGRESGVHDADLFLALALDGTGGNARVRLAEAVTLRDVAHLTRTVDEAVFRAEKDGEERLIGVRRTYVADLVVDEKDGIAVSAEAASSALAAYVAADFARLIKVEGGVRARIAFAARVLPDVLPDEVWPAVDDEALRALLPRVCAGKRTVAEVVRVDWDEVLREQLSWQQRKVLDDDLPARLTVPTGNAIGVDYTGAAPVLAVRLQELFGLRETPRIARGRVAVVLHLLSPGHKPVQVTTDLASFWSTTYAVVKKELRARYPKHSWPDDPLTAPPTARARRRGT